MKTNLYRHYDSQGVLLYIGVSLKQLQRLQQHSNSSFWFNQIETIKVEYFETRELALAAERAAIIAEKPLHNKQHSTFTVAFNELLGDFLQAFLLCNSIGEQKILLLLLKVSSLSSVEARVTLSYADIARQSGLSVRTVANCINELIAKEFITRVAQQSYKISPKLAWFGNQVDWAIALKELKNEKD